MNTFQEILMVFNEHLKEKFNELKVKELIITNTTLVDLVHYARGIIVSVEEAQSVFLYLEGIGVIEYSSFINAWIIYQKPFMELMGNKND